MRVSCSPDCKEGLEQGRTKDSDFVEASVGVLWCLVQRHGGRGAKDFGIHAERLAELDSVGGIETSGRVVPALQRCTGQSSLDDGHTLALTTRDTADELVADLGVHGMGHAIGGHGYVADGLGILLRTDARRQHARRPAASCKVKRLTDGQRRKVHIGLGG